MKKDYEGSSTMSKDYKGSTRMSQHHEGSSRMSTDYERSSRMSKDVRTLEGQNSCRTFEDFYTNRSRYLQGCKDPVIYGSLTKSLRTSKIPERSLVT